MLGDSSFLTVTKSILRFNLKRCLHMVSCMRTAQSVPSR